MEHSSRMFGVVTKTWNPISGCTHDCVYCWARKLALNRLKRTRRYRDGFIPKLNVEEFRRKFKSGFIFVSDMGDAFNRDVKDEWIVRVLEHISRFPKATFLLLTKNPERYVDFIDIMPQNVMLGSTIETDSDELYLKYKISKAPLPSRRLNAMQTLNWKYKFISIEPILDFTGNFAKSIADIKPVMVYVGYDNYWNKLPEPSLNKTLKLIAELRGYGMDVREKGIRRAWYEKNINRSTSI